jgi:hypothetical protein
MKRVKKIGYCMSVAAFSFIIITGSFQSNQANPNVEKSASPFFGGKGSSALGKSKYQYVGAEKCASVCHNNDSMGYQLNIWNKGPHREAFNVLISKKAKKYAKKAHLAGNPQESEVCLRCHVTGAGLDSSYFASTYKKEEGVTCEACHKREVITKAFLPTEPDCLKCHNNSVHKIDKFNFKEDCAKTAHPKPKKLSSTAK